MGWLTDAWRRRPLVLIGTSCYGLASVVYLLAGSIPFLLLGRFVHGVGLCCYTTAANAYVADIAPLRRRAEAMGFFSAAQAVGLIIGPVVGFLLIGTFGFQHLFSFAAGLSLTALLFSFFTRERRKTERNQAPALVPAHGHRGGRVAAGGLDGALHGDGLGGDKRLHRHLRSAARPPESRLLLHDSGLLPCWFPERLPAVWPTGMVVQPSSFPASS